MARLPRVVVPGLTHLIVHRARRAQVALADAADADQYVASLAAASREAGVAVHAYGLRGDEVRLLATPSTTQALATLMRCVGRRYVHAYNRRHGATGTPWEGRFRSVVVDAAQHWVASSLFAEMTPAGAAPGEPHATAWRSSAAHHGSGSADPVVEEHPRYWALGNTPFDRQARYRALAMDGLDPAGEAALSAAVAAGWPMGPAAFVEEVGRVSGRRTTPKRPGRPPKVRPVSPSPIKT